MPFAHGDGHAVRAVDLHAVHEGSDQVETAAARLPGARAPLASGHLEARAMVSHPGTQQVAFSPDQYFDRPAAVGAQGVLGRLVQ